MSFPSSSRLPAGRTLVVAATLAVLMTAIGLKGAPLVEKAAEEPSLFTRVSEADGGPQTPLYHVEPRKLAEAALVRFEAMRRGEAVTPLFLATLAAEAEADRIVTGSVAKAEEPPGWTFGPTLSQAEAGGSFFRRSITEALQPRALEPSAGHGG